MKMKPLKSSTKDSFKLSKISSKTLTMRSKQIVSITWMILMGSLFSLKKTISSKPYSFTTLYPHIENNISISGRSNQASSSRTINETKKNAVDTTSSKFEMMTFLFVVMKRMTYKVSKKTETLQQQNQEMQNKIVLLERQTQQKIFRPRGNNGWDKSRRPRHNQN
jgi:hypothetical protein